MTDNTVTITLTLPVDSATRKDVPIRSGCIDYFPAAIAGVAMHSVMGNNKHNPGEALHHARGKSMDHADCIDRHLTDIHDIEAWIERACGDEFQPPPEVVAMLLSEANANSWRALALSQELHERYGGAPLAPRARLPEVPPAPLGDGPLEPEGFPGGYDVNAGNAEGRDPLTFVDPPIHAPTAEQHTAAATSHVHFAQPLELPCGCVKRCKGHAVTEAAAAVDAAPSYALERAASTTADAEFPLPPQDYRMPPALASVEDRKAFDPAD